LRQLKSGGPDDQGRGDLEERHGGRESQNLADLSDGSSNGRKEEVHSYQTAKSKQSRGECNTNIRKGDEKKRKKEVSNGDIWGELIQELDVQISLGSIEKVREKTRGDATTSVLRKRVARHSRKIVMGNSGYIKGKNKDMVFDTSS